MDDDVDLQIRLTAVEHLKRVGAGGVLSAAFDANLIGIDPDLRIHVSPVLLSLNDGPMFEQGVKALVGRSVHLPARDQDHPDRNRLALRFEQFSAAL